MRAFLLERERGNVLIGETGALAGELPKLAELGVERQYLGHWHEAMFGPDEAARELGAEVIVGDSDAEKVREQGWKVDGTVTARETIDDDLEAIPIPGHTPGSVAYLWTTGGRRLLFTADSLYIRGGEWVIAVLESSDRERYADSLELLRGLEFDVLVPWAASGDGPYLWPVEPGESAERIGALLDELRSGDHR